MISQPSVPLWVQIVIVVGAAMCAAALTYPDPAFVLLPVIKFVLFVVNVGLTATAAFLTIKKSSP